MSLLWFTWCMCAMIGFSVRQFDPAKSIPFGSLFAPGMSLVKTQGFEFETRPTRPSLRTVLCGEVTYEVDGLRRTLRPGEAVVVGTGFRLVGGTARSHETICFACYPKGESDGWPANSHDVFVRLPSLPDDVQSGLNYLARGASRGDGARLEAPFDRCMELVASRLEGLCDMVARVPAKRARTRNDMVGKVLMAEASILRFRNGPLDLDRVSRDCGVARHHLTRVFKDVYGLTPRQFHEQERLRSAAGRLRVTALPVGQIALDHGYRDISVFTRAFTRVIGVSPISYRRQGLMR